ncbi:hypothetical protein [uncultured Legionella sp.]|uniref:hypothetical protein n=1 Tax=uncultured Legionella sp. TaxID=210934 RepID=UPI00262C5943|nr:hypothetical protein [uncultured Legionella sp.]
MLNKFVATTFSLIALAAPQYVHADDDSCEILVAVSSPPIQLDQSIAFNVTNNHGLSKSIIVRGGEAPKTIGKLPCSTIPYTISATAFNNAPPMIIDNGQQIGQCMLKAGDVILAGSNNSVTVVFPNDFFCNN